MADICSYDYQDEFLLMVAVGLEAFVSPAIKPHATDWTPQVLHGDFSRILEMENASEGIVKVREL